MKNPVTNVNAVISFEPAPEEYCRFSFVFLFFFFNRSRRPISKPLLTRWIEKKGIWQRSDDETNDSNRNNKKKAKKRSGNPPRRSKKKTVHNPVRKKKLGKTTHAHTHTKWGMGRTIRCDYKCVSPENKKKRERERERTRKTPKKTERKTRN